MLKIMLYLLMLSSVMYAISNKELATKNDMVMSGFQDSTSDMYMTLINASGQERKRKMKMSVLEKEGGDKSLMEFLSPADVKGTKFLSYSHIEKDDDQWLYIPALKRIKRIASKNKSGSFMGSEFSYEDLSSMDVEKYSYNGDAKKVKYGAKESYKGERTPKSSNSGYTKQVFWTDAKNFLTLKVDYYDRKHALFKTATFSDYKKISGVWRVGKMMMLNHQNDKKTILLWKNENIKNGLKEKDFHKRMLRP